MLSRLHREESGFTLVELLTAMSLGIVILMAAFLLIDHATSASNTIAKRQDAVQRGRLAMEQITSELRSQVCLGDQTRPIVSATPNSVTFYGDMSGNGTAQLRSLTYDTSTPAHPRINESVTPGVGVYPQLTFPAAGTRTRPVLEDVIRAKEGSADLPIFRYYTFREGGVAGDLIELVPPANGSLAPADASRVVLIKVAFVARPDTDVKNLASTTFLSDVYVRIADPSQPKEGPRCI
jgi:hypothetical protein